MTISQTGLKVRFPVARSPVEQVQLVIDRMVGLPLADRLRQLMEAEARIRARDNDPELLQAIRDWRLKHQLEQENPKT
jgi:hypothetical protein